MKIVVELSDEKWQSVLDGTWCGSEEIAKGIPLRKGRWILKVKGLQITSYICSECGRYVRDDTGYDVSKDYPFCHCGADMREVEA